MTKARTLFPSFLSIAIAAVLSCSERRSSTREVEKYSAVSLVPGDSKSEVSYSGSLMIESIGDELADAGYSAALVEKIVTTAHAEVSLAATLAFGPLDEISLNLQATESSENLTVAIAAEAVARGSITALRSGSETSLNEETSSDVVFFALSRGVKYLNDLTGYPVLHDSKLTLAANIATVDTVGLIAKAQIKGISSIKSEGKINGLSTDAIASTAQRMTSSLFSASSQIGLANDATVGELAGNVMKSIINAVASSELKTDAAGIITKIPNSLEGFKTLRLDADVLSATSKTIVEECVTGINVAQLQTDAKDLVAKIVTASVTGVYVAAANTESMASAASTAAKTAFISYNTLRGSTDVAVQTEAARTMFSSAISAFDSLPGWNLEVISAVTSSMRSKAVEATKEIGLTGDNGASIVASVSVGIFDSIATMPTIEKLGSDSTAIQTKITELSNAAIADIQSKFPDAKADYRNAINDAAKKVTTTQNNAAPTDLTLSNQILAENSGSNAVVGNLSATDPDASNTITYSLVAGTGSTDNGSFNILGSQLRMTESADFETKSPYSIRVRATDQGGLFFEKHFVISITNVNEAPTLAVIADQTTLEDKALTVALSPFDADGNLSCTSTNLSYVFSNPSGGTSIGAVSWSGNWPSCFATITPVFNYSGSSSVTITVTDGSLYTSQIFNLTVTAVNDPPVISDVPGQITNQDTTLSGVSVSISDIDSALSCNSIAASSSNTILIPATNVTLSGTVPNCLISLSPAARQTGASTITLTVSDGTLSAQDTFVLTVSPVNSAPTDLLLSSLSIAENSGENALVGTLSATDPDTGDTFTYILASGTGSTDNGSFNISGNQLRMTASADFETKSSYSIRVRATDQGGLFIEKQLTITVTNINEAPTNLALSSLSLAENSGPNAVVGNLSATDPDAANTFTYSLVTGTGSTDYGSFNIYGNQLRMTESADFETKSPYSIRVRATDQGGLFFEKHFVISITNVNEAPTLAVIADQTTLEDKALTVALSPFDTDGNLSCTSTNLSIVFSNPSGGTSIGAVSWSGNWPSCFATITPVFNYSGSSSVMISVTDGSLYTSQIFNLTVTAVNDPPVISDVSNKQINQATVLSEVAVSVSISDIDSTLNCNSIAASSSNTTLIPATNVTLSGTVPNCLINLSPLGGQAGSSTITLTISDGTSSAQDTFVLTVSPVNSAPTDLLLSSLSIAENSGANAVVGNLSATDPDATNTFTYNLVAGTGNTDNGSFNISGNQLRMNSSADFETKSSYSIFLRATDQGGLFFEKQFPITITNVNEAPTNLALSSLSLAENSGSNAVVGNLSATDPDAANTFTYTLVAGTGSTDNGSFNILGNQLRMNSSADFETKSSYWILLRATDQGGLFIETQLNITITNLNEAPTNLALSSLSLAENSGPNAVVGNLSATDPDATNTFTYNLVAGTGNTDNGSFNISGNQLRMNSSADFETKSSYSIFLRATDQGGLFFEKQFPITITNVNEAPTNLALSSLSLAENSGSNAVVGNLSATDPDAANTFTYTLVAGTGSTDNGSFNILGNQLRMNSSADFETKSSYSILLRATDQGGLFFEKQLNITITNINEAPSLSAISNQTTIQDTPTAAISLTVMDVDGLPITCNATYLSYTSQNTTVVASTGAINWAGTWPNCTAVITPVTGATGSSLLSISVSDGLLTSVPQSFSLQVGSKSVGWAQEAYLKASNANASDYFGYSVAISGDTAVIGAQNESSNQTTITNGITSSADNTAFDAGASYIYKRTGTNWAQEAYLKASNAEAYDNFGYSVAISGDTAVIGAYLEASNQTTITNGTTSSADNSALAAGASYIYKRTGTNWAQEAYLKASNANASDLFGESVAISGDTAVIGAQNQASNQTTITNGTTSSADNSALAAGASYIYKRTGTNWAQEAYLKASNAEAYDNFGYSVAISGDTAVIGARWESSNQTTITNGTTSSANNSALAAGASYIYKRTGTNWAQEAYLKASNANAYDYFGDSVAISGDTAVIGARGEASNQTTIINGTISSANTFASARDVGASYIYRRTGTTWAQEAYLKASNANASDWFGYSVAISGDTAVIGAPYEDSNQTTITNGTTSSGDNTALEAGASYIYKRTGTTWAQEAYLKASNANASDYFGWSVAISGDTAVIGAYQEDSNQTTITNGATSSADNTAANAGAAYVYRSLSRIFDPDLRVSAKTTTAITLSWGSNLGSASQVKIAPAVSGTGTPLPCTDASAVTLADGATTYTYSGLTTGTKYGFRVCGFDGTNVSQGSFIWENTN